MVVKALDYSTSRPSPTCLYDAGYRVVMRYVWTSYDEKDSRWPGKMLIKSEADKLRAAGLDIVSNFESWTGRAREGFTAGVADAAVAVAVTAAAGGPDDSVIYFSVDEDVAGSSVAPYFKGVASVIGLARTGAYGSYRVIRYLFDNTLIAKGWQTYAWSGKRDAAGNLVRDAAGNVIYNWDSRAHIRQVKNGVQVCGGDTDLDEVRADDYGGWSQGGVDVPLEAEDIKKVWEIRQINDVIPSPRYDRMGNPVPLDADGNPVTNPKSTPGTYLRDITETLYQTRGELAASRAAEQARDEALAVVVNAMAKVIEAGGGSVDTAGVLAGVDERLAALKADLAAAAAAQAARLGGA